ncbi:hypothetical protein BOX15_Mlig008849g3, partial [Macrostomum lignano]
PQQQKVVGEFSPYHPLVPGFKHHTEPVRCAIWEVFVAVLPLVLGLSSRNALLCLAPGLANRAGRLGHLLLDHGLITSAFCLCIVTFPAASYAVPVAVSAVVAVAVNVAALARLLARRRRGQWLWWLPAELGEPAFSAEQAGRARFITEFRGLIYLPTCACILARDLPCFRLPFGKTRTFGTGLMDVGLGCFVFLMGLTAPTCRARALNRHQRQAALLKQTVLCLLLTGCGLVRLAVAPDQAVEEYGRDWNVFFTLAAVKMVGSATELLLLPPQSRLPPALPACLLLAAYEVALGPVGRLAITIVRPESAADAQAPAAAAAAALTARRDAGFFEANREGLVACLGLYCLYLLALQVGRLALPVLASRRPADVGRVTGWCAAVAAATLALRVLPAAGLALPESRRLGNAAYVAWILGFCCAYMAACAFASCLFAALAGPYPVSSNNVHLREHQREHQSEHLSQPPPPPASPFLQLVDQHGLAYFLIGNLLTGLTGRCILPALYGRPDFGRVMPPAACAPVLMAYMLVLSLATTWLLPAICRLLAALWRRTATAAARRESRPTTVQPPLHLPQQQQQQFEQQLRLQTISSV